MRDSVQRTCLSLCPLFLAGQMEFEEAVRLLEEDAHSVWQRATHLPIGFSTFLAGREEVDEAVRLLMEEARKLRPFNL